MRMLLVLALLVSATHASSLAQSNEVREEFSAVAISAGGLYSSPVAGQLQIAITRWTTEAERTRLMQALQKGQDAALDVMHRLPVAGSVRAPGNLGWALRYAHEERTDEGLRQITLATDRPMGLLETWEQARTVQYPFLLIELQVDGKGRGKGRLMRAVRVTVSRNGRYIGLENYETDPIMLNDVRKTD